MADKTTELRVVADRYVLNSVRGRGGMGTVWEADDRLLERRVAVKEVPLRDRGALGDEGTLRHRVLREARVAARVSHPNLVTIYDVVDGGDRVFLVQEYVDAPTLHDTVSRDGALDPVAAAAIGQQVLAALDALHEAGIVHRDVKPSNVLVLAGGGVKVADFGIALVEDDRDLTLAGSVLGSPGYLAPEQASGRRAEAAADLWALGATLWFAVEGHGPYGDTPGLAAIGEVVHGPVPVAAHAGVLAPALVAMLRKDPATRASSAEVAGLLESATAGGPAAPAETQALAPTTVAAPMPPPPATPPPPVPPAPSPSGWLPASPPPAAAAARPGSSTGPWLAGLAAVVLLIALVAGGLALASGGGDEKTAASTATTAAPAASTTAPTRAPSTTSRRSTSTEAASAGGAGVPSGWQRYEDTSAGYALAHPAGWQVKKLDGTRTDFIDPTTGAYLRVDWTDKPGDPLEAWERSSKAFGSSHAGYEEIRVEEQPFKGFDGAIWEYRYASGRGKLHATNVTFVASESRAYALNFQTDDTRWEDDQDLRSQLEESFDVTATKKGQGKKSD